MHTYFQIQNKGANKRARTRSALIDSAITIFSEKSFEEVKISDIAHSAGLANGTFYNHFKDKDELVIATAQAIAFEIAKSFDDKMANVQRGLTRIIVATSAFLQTAANSPEWGRVLIEHAHRQISSDVAATTFLQADLKLAASQQKLAITLDAFLIEQVSALVLAAMRKQLHNPQDTSISQRTCENVLRLLGLSPKQAHKEVTRAAPYLLNIGINNNTP